MVLGLRGRACLCLLCVRSHSRSAAICTAAIGTAAVSLELVRTGLPVGIVGEVLTAPFREMMWRGRRH